MTQADEYHVLGEGLYHWSVYDPEIKCELGCTALIVKSGLVVIDPIPLAKTAWDELLALAPLRAVLLTNGNHLREAEALRKVYHVPIVTTAATRKDLASTRPDVILLEKELIYGITPISIPGATPGETAFFAETGVMIVGDAVLNVDREKGLELLPDKYCDNAEQNKASLKKLLEFNFHTLIFGHGSPLTAHAREKLELLLQVS